MVKHGPLDTITILNWNAQGVKSNEVDRFLYGVPRGHGEWAVLNSARVLVDAIVKAIRGTYECWTFSACDGPPKWDNELDESSLIERF